ncbi:MAG: biotin carboxylase N-terminal domain-containing protein [Nanoarchaeota archaeon]
MTLPDIADIWNQVLRGGVRVTGTNGNGEDLEVRVSQGNATRKPGQHEYVMFVQNRDTVVTRVRATIDRFNLPIELVGIVDATREGNPNYAGSLDKVVSLTPAANRTTPFLDPNVAVHLKGILGVNAVYSGWGFLAESASAIDIWEKAGLIHVGPRTATIYNLGDKVQFRRICQEINVPVVPGTFDYVNSAEEARRIFDKLGGKPIRIKAANGGGGMGQVVARSLDEVEGAYRSALESALRNFGDSKLYVELNLDTSGEVLRHIEVQFMGNGNGDVQIHGDRDCSIQDKNKKLIEIGTADFIDQETRDQLYQYTREIAKRLNYRGAGTFEFLIAKSTGEYRIYGLEINARLQVEHPVTEMLTDVDLVYEQLKVALGLGELQDMSGRVRPGFGRAMELRILAEQYRDGGFHPCPGKITALEWPTAPYVRIETAVIAGSEITPHFDSTIGRMIIHGHNLEELFENARKAVNNTRIEGLRGTTLHSVFQPLFNDERAVARLLNQQYGLNDLRGIMPPYS